MKILVPIDFSPLSKVAVLYAANMCVTLKAQLILMNVAFDQRKPTPEELACDPVMMKRYKEREDQCVSLIEEIKQRVQGEWDVEYIVQYEAPLNERINEVATRNECDLIIMGTKGASGIKKALIGSNASEVINYCQIPVLTIPEFAIFKGLKELLYASDMDNLSEEFSLLLPVARIFNTTVHVLNIYKTGAAPQIDEITMAATLQKEFNYPKIKCHYVAGADVKSGIDQYLNGRNADILAMFSGKRNFFKRIFEESNTREFIFQSTVPLLTFSKKLPSDTR